VRIAIAVMLRDLVGTPEEVPRNWISIPCAVTDEASIMRDRRQSAMCLIALNAFHTAMDRPHGFRCLTFRTAAVVRLPFDPS